MEYWKPMETTIHLEVCTGYDSDGDYVFEELPFETEASCNSHTGGPGIPAGVELEWSDKYRDPSGRVWTSSEVDVLLSLGGYHDLEAILEDTRDGVIENYLDSLSPY